MLLEDNKNHKNKFIFCIEKCKWDILLDTMRKKSLFMKKKHLLGKSDTNPRIDS